MLYKLFYLLGPENEKYLKENNQKPFSFTDAVRKTLEIYGYSPYNTTYLGSGENSFDKAKRQLTLDYLNFMETISDDKLSEKI